MSSQNQSKVHNQLIPVPVSWMVAPAVPHLTLTVNDYGTHTAKFLAVFLTKEGDQHEREVEVTFEGGGWFKVSGVYSEISSLDESVFDRSEVGLRSESELDISDWIKMFKEQWANSNICPDPRMYEVRNSDWLAATLGSVHDAKHVIILGEELYIEALCKDWEVKIGDIIDWSGG